MYANFVVEYLLESGHDVTFFTASNHARLDVFPNHSDFEIVQLAPLNVNDEAGGYLGTIQDQWTRVRQFQTGMSIARNDQLDLVHFLTVDWFPLPIWLSTLLGTESPPIVGTLHRDYRATDKLQPKERLLPRLKREMKRTFDRGNRRALASCLEAGPIDRLLVHAPSMRERLLSTLDLPGNAVRTVAAPTPKPDEVLETGEARPRLDLPTDDLILLFFGTLGYPKGPDILGRALRSVERDVTVVYAGSEGTFGREDVERWRLESPANVRVLSRLEFVPEVEVYPYFSAADFLLLPYRRRYGISGPLRRACMVQTPVIGSDSTDVGDIIAENGLGTTFEYGNSRALAETIDAVDPPEPFSEALARYCEQITAQKAGESFEDIYRDILY
jgi:glycosyltransferase involved in cell wall biosynthesis